MAEDKLQFQRFELKYVIRQDVALAVRDFIRAYLEIDEFGALQPNLAYPVHSLYLDSEHLATYWHTINGDKNRYKLRLRFYADQPVGPVFFEIKRRVNDAILKQRGAVRRDAVHWLLSGHLPEPDHLVSQDPKQLVALQRFCELMTDIRAKPRAHVSYCREAWINPHNNAVRLTMDREVRCDPESSSNLSCEMRRPVLVFGQNVVLELKFTGRYPDWFRELVRIFGLTQCSAAKYADGVALLGESAFGQDPSLADDDYAAEKVKARLDLLKKAVGAGGIRTAA